MRRKLQLGECRRSKRGSRKTPQSVLLAPSGLAGRPVQNPFLRFERLSGSKVVEYSVIKVPRSMTRDDNDACLFPKPTPEIVKPTNDLVHLFIECLRRGFFNVRRRRVCTNVDSIDIVHRSGPENKASSTFDSTWLLTGVEDLREVTRVYAARFNGSAT